MKSEIPENAAPESAPPVGPPLDRAGRRLKAAADALRTLLRDLYAERFGAVPADFGDLNLHLRLRARPSHDWQLEFDPPLPDQLAAQFEDAQAAQDVYRRGAVYCFRCSSSACEHAGPPSPLSVFGGYDSTGRPEWSELAQALVDLKDERVDRLFARPAQAVAALQYGHQLRGEQLASFGRSSKTYAVLGQVIAGYFAVLAPGPGDPAGRVAVTLQVVEARGAGGRIRLHLNALARMPEGGELEDALAGGWEPALFRARAVAARAVEALERQVQGARESGGSEEVRALMRRVPLILRRLADHLTRGERQSHRRTRHAEERRDEQRPVHKAMDDAREASAENVFYDERASTLIVHGARGRAHAFNAEGRHVTSFVLKPDGLDHRLRSRRWRPVSPEEFQVFKSAIPAADGAR
jgi:hypothetical protein